MTDTGTEISCKVCDQKLGKPRVHYGGVSCYSCRAFFRRNTQRHELPVCKAEEECNITISGRKQCAACRYQKCLRIGMKPELVLDEDEKKTRFRKFLSKKAVKEEPTEEPQFIPLKVELNTDDSNQHEQFTNDYIAGFQEEQKLNLQYFCEQQTFKREELYSAGGDREEASVISSLASQPLTQITADDVDQHLGGFSGSSYMHAGNVVRKELIQNGVSVIERMPRQEVLNQDPYIQQTQNRKSVIVRARLE